MDRSKYELIENYMFSCMRDSVHDKEHIYRVLNVALEIAEGEAGVNYDVLIAACLLHDIARQEQYENPKNDHAVYGAEKAYKFLIENGFAPAFSQHVADCIKTHRFRGSNIPQSIEAKILFDADKIDVTGTLGIARTLFYNGIVGEPLYSLDSERNVLDGIDDSDPSFFQEYNYKLKNVYAKLLTETGKSIAESRRQSAIDFYNSMLAEVSEPYKKGKELLKNHID